MTTVAARASTALARSLRAATRDRLEVAVRPGGDGPAGGGPRVTVGRGGTEQTLAPFWAGEGFPADVRAVLRVMRDSPLDDGATPVVVARRLSPGARALLTDLDTSWADESGALDVASGPILVHTPGAPPLRQPRPLRFTPAAGALAELLLTRATAGEHLVPTITDLATRTGISRGATSRALMFFDAQGWTSSRGPQRGPAARRELLERRAMLEAWGRWYANGRDETVETHTVIRDPSTWLRDVVARRWRAGTWAVTGLAALDQRAPFATAVNPIDLYLHGAEFDSDLDAHLRAVGLVRVDTGVRVRVLRADRHLHLPDPETPTETGFPVVDDVRLYGDLLRRGGVRAEDYATHLREHRIGF